MVNKIKPIKPGQAAKKKKAEIPDEAFEAFNELIAEHFNGRVVIIAQEDVVKLMVKKGLNREEIFKKGWLNIDEAYHKAGWEVKYDRPGWDDDYVEHFTFTAHNPK